MSRAIIGNSYPFYKLDDGDAGTLSGSVGFSLDQSSDDDLLKGSDADNIDDLDAALAELMESDIAAMDEPNTPAAYKSNDDPVFAEGDDINDLLASLGGGEMQENIYTESAGGGSNDDALQRMLAMDEKADLDFALNDESKINSNFASSISTNVEEPAIPEVIKTGFYRTEKRAIDPALRSINRKQSFKKRLTDISMQRFLA